VSRAAVSAGLSTSVSASRRRTARGNRADHVTGGILEADELPHLGESRDGVVGKTAIVVPMTKAVC
jgi:hypothetical protein